MTSRAQVQALQAAINRWAAFLSFSPLKVDGIAGKYTLAATKQLIQSVYVNPDQVAYDFLTTPEVLIGTDGLVVNLTQMFDQKADQMNMPAVKPIPTITVASGGGKALVPAHLAPATVGRDQTASAGMLGLGLPNWMVYSGGAAFVLAIGLLILKRKRIVNV